MGEGVMPVPGDADNDDSDVSDEGGVYGRGGSDNNSDNSFARTKAKII